MSYYTGTLHRENQTRNCTTKNTTTRHLCIVSCAFVNRSAQLRFVYSLHFLSYFPEILGRTTVCILLHFPVTQKPTTWMRLFPCEIDSLHAFSCTISHVFSCFCKSLNNNYLRLFTSYREIILMLTGGFTPGWFLSNVVLLSFRLW